MAIDFAELAIKVKFDDVGRATVELDKMTVAGRRAQTSTEGLGESHKKASGHITDSSRAMTLMQMRAIAMNEALNNGNKHLGFWDSIHQQAAGHVGEHSLAIGRLERALAGIVGHFFGANAAAELLASGLLKFSVGTLETVGVLAGIAAVVGLYEKMTEGAREAKKQIDDMTASLLQQARSAEEATVAGRKNLLLIAEINQQTVGKESGIGWRSILGAMVTGRNFMSDTDKAAQEGRRQDTADAVTQARKNLTEAEEEARRKELERLKKIDEERARQQALLIRYNEMMEKAYGGVLGIAPMTSAQRASWLDSQHGRGLTDQEHADLNKQLGFDASGRVSIPSVSIPNVGINDGLTKEQVHHLEIVKQLNEAYQQSIAPFKSLSAAITDFKQGLQQAATSFGQQFSPGAIGGRLLGKIAGDTSSAGGTAGGAAGLAVGAFFGPFGAAVGAAIGSRIGNVVEDLVTGGGAAKRTADRLAADSAHAMALQLDAVTKLLSGDQLGGALDALKIGLISSLQAINDALPGKKNEAQRNAARTLAQQQEAEQEARTQKQFAEQKQYAQEDLQVRLLRATGQGSAADLQAFKNTQAREMQAALDANKDATYLNTLKLVQNNELLAFLNGTLSDAVRNAPSGFYGIAGYAGAYATPRGPDGYPTDGGTIGSDRTGWQGGGNRSKGSSPGNFTLTFQPGALVVDKNGMMNVVLEKIDIAASGTGGAGTSRSAALDTMTRR